MRRDVAIGDLIEAEGNGGGLALIGWGFVAVVAVVLAFASWQYAPTRSVPTETARGEGQSPDPSEITGSIASSDRGQTLVQPSRVVGAGRVQPMPLAGNETLVTSRDIDQLRSELRDIQRRIVQIGMSGDGVSRRIDRIEERVSGLAAREVPTAATAAAAPAASPSPVPAALLAIVGEPAKGLDTVSASDRPVPYAERLPLPQPRPVVEASPTPPASNFDVDGPTITGAVPKHSSAVERIDTPDTKVAKNEAAAKSDAAPKTAKSPVAAPAVAPVVATVPASPVPAAPVEETAPARATPTTTVAIAPSNPQPPAPAVQPAAVSDPQAGSAPTAKAGQGGVAVDLGGFRTLASLRRAWSDMTVRHGDLAKGLEPLARLRETESGMEARLLAGPFADQTEAARVCLRLRAVGATCTVTTHSGQALGGLR